MFFNENIYIFCQNKCWYLGVWFVDQDKGILNRVASLNCDLFISTWNLFYFLVIFALCGKHIIDIIDHL